MVQPLHTVSLFAYPPFANFSTGSGDAGGNFIVLSPAVSTGQGSASANLHSYWDGAANLLAVRIHARKRTAGA